MKNFKELKDTITQNLCESVIKGEKNKDFTKFVKEVKKSPILKLQMEAYDNLENGKAIDMYEATYFITQNMKGFNSYTKDEILSANRKLVESFGYELGEGDYIFSLMLENASDFKISNRGFGYAENFKKAGQRLIENSMAVVTESTLPEINPALPMKKVIKRATEILNEKFSFLDETEVKIVQSYIKKDEEEKEKIFNQLVSENLKLVKRKLFESEDETLKEKLTKIQDKLNDEFNYTSVTEISEFAKLIDLQNILR